MSELLFEIGTEEIPAGYIQPALETIAAEAAKKLQALGLTFGAIRTYGTPRRLTLVVKELQAKQEDRRVEHIGPAKKAGFDVSGQLTKAAIGFARSKGLSPEQLKVVATAKGEYLMAVEDVKGQETAALLPAMLTSIIHELVFPKSMRWANSMLTFARPIQWLLGLFNGKVIPLTLEEYTCGNTSRGHRFLAPQPFAVDGADSYLRGLAERYILADPDQRRAKVIEEVERAVRERVANPEARPVLHEGLLDTVTHLVEYPYGICGRFAEKFLQLPEEVLVTSMREHQKYFPVIDAAGKLLPHFVAVNNTRIDDVDLAASGHERVLRARLEDGLFFFNEDRKRPLAERCGELKGIVFQNKLGTMQEKSERLVILAGKLAELAAPGLRQDVARAALLAKADLLTAMVGEFPSLQGVMGRVYALHDGEKPEIAQAIEEHYLPLRAGGDLPKTMLGGLVGLADRMDTLVGCFAIGERPTGNKDAFGLRRQAIGLINIVRKLDVPLSLSAVAGMALAGYKGIVTADEGIVDEVLAFIRLRFENEQISAGLPQELVEAATSVGFDDIRDCLKRIAALESIRTQEQFAVLAGSFKRIRNIVKENKATVITESLLGEEAEKALFAALNTVRQQTLPLIDAGDYTAALASMLAMKEPVDRFFDEVMVMAEDATVRQNRLNLLTALGELVLKVGDISKMHRE